MVNRHDETSPGRSEGAPNEDPAAADDAASTDGGRFVLEVDLGRLDGDPSAELGRILRYWGGNLQHYPLQPGSGETVWTAMAEVGRWRVEPTPG